MSNPLPTGGVKVPLGGDVRWLVAVVKDEDIGELFEAVSDRRVEQLDFESLPTWAPATRLRTGPDGTVTADLDAGDYLFCTPYRTGFSDCTYEDVTAGQHRILYRPIIESSSWLVELDRASSVAMIKAMAACGTPQATVSCRSRERYEEARRHYQDTGATALASARGVSVVFADLSQAGPLRSEIEALAGIDVAGAAEGVFGGTECSTDSAGAKKLCPTNAIVRRTVAVWLVRVLDLLEPTATSGRFDDVSTGAWWNPHVNRLFTLGVTQGCRTRRFCPEATVTRAQMAVFLVRAYNLPPAPSANFTDVAAGYWAKDQIDRLHGAGITVGCSQTPLKFCPEAAVTRAQMAAFLDRARNYTPPTTTTPQQPSRPPAPAITKITPGPGTLTIEWQHTTGTPRANGWVIKYVRLTPAPPREMIHETKTQPLAASGADNETHTLEGLEFGAHYRISIKGVASSRGTAVHGSYSTPATKQTDPAAVNLVALEITQGLQNWTGDITLVKGKRTVVRAFLEPVSGKTTTVNVKLHAVRGGRIIATASPENRDTQLGVLPRDFNPYLFTTRPGVARRRGQLNASANFLLDLSLPAIGRNWIGDLDDAPEDDAYEITYRLEVTEGAVCQEAAAPADQCRADLEFIGVRTPRVRIVAIRTRDSSTGSAVELKPTAADLMEQADRIASLMPVPALRYELRHYNRVVEPPPAGLAPLLVELLAARANDGDTSAYLGVMLGGTGGGRAGDIPSNVAVWYTSGTDGTGSTGRARNRGSHEFGHVIGERHAAYEDLRDADGNPDTRMLTICSGIDTDMLGSAGNDAVPYPYIDVDRRPPLWLPPTAAFLGPMTAAETDDSTIWGFDTRFVDGSFPRLAVVDPGAVDSLMSYCAGDAGSQHRWVDEFHHERFIDAINGIDWDVGPDRSTAGSPPPNPMAAFFGYVTSAADGTVADVTVLPVFTFAPAAAPATTAAGEYQLELLGSSGEVVRSLSFDAHLTVADAGGSARGSELWAVHVDDPPAYASYRIRRGSQQIVEVQRSAAAPTVAVTAPAAGQALSGDTVEFAWSGSDLDGDALSYLVQYSIDGGANYETIAVDHPSNTLRVPRSSLAGSSRARLRVVACDGARSATVQSAVFSVTESAPEVFVRSPSPGAIYGGLRSITLEAAAYDSEDGALDASSIVWSSDIDAQVAAGAHAVIDTGDLTSGTHVLTATASDSSAMTSSASVTITVRAANDAPSAASDTAHARAATTVAVDAAANDTDPEADLDPSSLSVLVAPAQGTATVAVSVDAPISYASTRPGIDVLIYEICDRANQCATAEVTVFVSDDT